MVIDVKFRFNVNKDVETLVDLLDSKLCFQTNDGEFQGILKFVVTEKQRVLFEHVYCLPSHKYIGTMDIKLSDFLCYKLLRTSDTSLNSWEDRLNVDLEKQERIDEYVDLRNTNIQLKEHVPSHLQNTCPDNFCFIESVCPTFFRAIDCISRLKTVGLSFHGPNLSRKGILSLICITTSKSVFIFDIDTMGIAAFHQGLQRIFEDENIEKIVHDCRKPADCLQHLFQTTLTSVFDTQIADYLIRMQRCTDDKIFQYVSSLDYCLVKYLKVPQPLLYNRNKCIPENAEIQFYKKRPLTDEFKNILIKSSIYLLSLKKKQEQLLLYPFHQAVDVCLNVVREASEAEVFRMPNQSNIMAPQYLSECIPVVEFCNRQDTSDVTDAEKCDPNCGS